MAPGRLLWKPLLLLGWGLTCLHYCFEAAAGTLQRERTAQPACVTSGLLCAVLLRRVAPGAAPAPQACVHSCQGAEMSTQAGRGEEGEERRAGCGGVTVVQLACLPSFFM